MRTTPARRLSAVVFSLVCALATVVVLLVGAGSASAQAQAGGGRRIPRPTFAPYSDAGAPLARDGGAAARDGGAPTTSGVDGGASEPGDGGAPADPTANLAPIDVAAAAAGNQVRVPTTEAEKAEGQPIEKIEISGNRRVAQEDVVTYLREKKGMPFSTSLLTSDVRALWDSTFFDDIEVDLTRSDRGVALRFLVRERPNIKSIEYDGNEEIDDDKLNESVELKPNTILSVPAVRRSVQKIKDAYAEKGFFLADCEFVIEPQRDNEVVVRFKIKEHQPVTVRRVTFIGNYTIPDEELRDQMQTGAGGILSFGSGGPYRQDVFERDILLLNALYYDKGFMNVQIGTPRVMLTPDREGIDITVAIHEGPRYKIRQLRVYERDADGNEVEPIGGRKALRLLVRAKSGDYFNRAELMKDLLAVRTLYRDNGFANVEADPDMQLDAGHNEVDIVIPIRRGPAVSVERIEIKGNSKTRDRVVRREMEIEEGQIFSETKLENSKKRITALGYFDHVDVSTEQGSAPDKMIINFEVGERPTGTFQVGAGFSSVENFIVTAQVQQANLFGNGQSLALQAQVSGLRQLISVRFFEPYFFGTNWNSSAEIFDQLYIFPDFARRSLGGSMTFGYGLIQPYLRLGVTLKAESDKVDTTATQTVFGSTSSNYSVFQRLPLANLFNDGRTISVQPTITFDRRDNRLFPSSGVFLQASTEFANSALGSQIEYLRHSFTGRFYLPLGLNTGQPGSGFVLKMNTNIGLITSPSSQGVPIFARYFLGGILDVRGYQLRTIGPRLPLNQSLNVNAPPIANGADIGGNLQAYMNLELEFPIIDKVGIRGVLFYDMGNAWNTEDQFCKTTPAPQFDRVINPCFSASSLTYLRTSVGFGVRWFSPLGPLRFEWGFPLEPLPYEDHSVFEFTIGNFF
jgi:outer membrane protein insertion porin family